MQNSNAGAPPVTPQDIVVPTQMKSVLQKPLDSINGIVGDKSYISIIPLLENLITKV